MRSTPSKTNVLSGLLVLTCLMAAPVSAYVPLTVSFSGGEAVVAHWRQSSFPVTVVASDGLSPDISGDAGEQALRNALDSWSSVAGSAARLRYGGEGDFAGPRFVGRDHAKLPADR